MVLSWNYFNQHWFGEMILIFFLKPWLNVFLFDWILPIVLWYFCLVEDWKWTQVLRTTWLMVLIISGWSPVLISFASYYCGCLVWVNRAGERGGEATFFLLIYKTLVDYRYTAIRKIGFWCGSWVEDKDDEIFGAWNMKNLWLNTRIWTNTLSVKVHGQRNKGMMGSPSRRGRLVACGLWWTFGMVGVGFWSVFTQWNQPYPFE